MGKTIPLREESQDQLIVRVLNLRSKNGRLERALNRARADLKASEAALDEPQNALDANWVQHQRIVAAENRAESAEAERENAFQLNQQLTDIANSEREMRVEAERRAEDLRQDAERWRYEEQKNRAMFDSAIQKLVAIHSLIQGDDVVLPDGRKFKFAPPDSLVREAWEGLSKAIRDIPAAIDTAIAKEAK